jgi:hypothetical protein
MTILMSFIVAQSKLTLALTLEFARRGRRTLSMRRKKRKNGPPRRAFLPLRLKKMIFSSSKM